MDEIEVYLQSSLAAVQEEEILEAQIRGKDPDAPPRLAQRYYEHAQLLAAVGRQDEAVLVFHKALSILNNYIDSEVYSTLFYSASTQLVVLYDNMGNLGECEKLFEKLNQFRPSGWHIGDYAFFLHRRKRDYEAAELYYKKSLAVYPNQSSIYLKYAGFLRHIRKDLVGAEQSYERAVAVNPSNADAVGSYASFLHGVHHRIEEAAVLYEKAIALDDTHTNNLCNFGLFLSEERQQFDRAEQQYKRVLEVNAKHTNTLYNYAVLLDTHLKRKSEAQTYYRAALELDTKHAYALYNLAVLLEEQFFTTNAATDAQRDEVQALYRRAVEADSRDANTLADYGRFLYLRCADVSQAEGYLQAALKADAQCESALYHVAVIAHRERKQLDTAKAMLQRLLAMQPTHANGMLQLARILADQVRLPALSGVEKEAALDEAVRAYAQAVPLHADSPTVITEYLRLVQTMGTNKMKLAAIRAVADFLPKNVPAKEDTSGNTAIRRNSVVDCQSLMDEIKASL